MCSVYVVGDTYMSKQVPVEVRRGCSSPGAGVTGSVPPRVGTRNQIWVLSRAILLLTVEPIPSPISLVNKNFETVLFRECSKCSC